jgi:hypothetical protein
MKQMAASSWNLIWERITRESGLDAANPHGAFTAHCLRRGAAQWWHCHAKKKLTLEVLSAWGGWVEGEAVSRLLRMHDLMLLGEHSLIFTEHFSRERYLVTSSNISWIKRPSSATFTSKGSTALATCSRAIACVANPLGSKTSLNQNIV